MHNGGVKSISAMAPLQANDETHTTLCFLLLTLTIVFKGQ